MAGGLVLLYLGLQFGLLLIRLGLTITQSCIQVGYMPVLLPLAVLTIGTFFFGLLLHPQGRRNLLVFFGAMGYFGLASALFLG